MSQKTMGHQVRKLTESSLMLAASFVLSLLPVMEMPFGGSVTAASMLPVILIAYRNGTVWGLFTGFAFSLLQLLVGMKNLSYATSAAAAVSIVLLDYLVAFTVLGLAGLFRRQKSQVVGLTAGVLFVCVLRYVCHVITGCTVWAGVSIPTTDGLWYSLSYNAAYMVPETLLTVIAAAYLAKVLDFRAERLRRSKSASQGVAADVCAALSLLALAVVVAVDALLLFAAIQTEEGFDITAISSANWPLIGIISAAGLVLAAALFCLGRFFAGRKKKEET